MIKIEAKLEFECPSSIDGRIYYLISNKLGSKKVYTNLRVSTEDWKLGANDVRLKGMRKQYLIFIPEIRRSISPLRNFQKNILSSKILRRYR